MNLTKTKQWLKTSNINFTDIQIASADASFRSYYRIYIHDKTMMVMDSSLQKESLIPFVDITERLSRVGVSVPAIYEQSLDDGFLLLEDLGSVDLLDRLSDDTFEGYYERATDEIVKMQEANGEGLPLYSRDFLIFEMELMEEWYLRKHLGVDVDASMHESIQNSLTYIADEVLSQPQGVFVHRDFHSRNIMLRGDDSLAVIDYQDARVGAVTYDLVSLLRDCYREFDCKKIEALALQFRDKKKLDIDDETFMRWFDCMGLQRHIKILGIFARLSIRDGKDGYLDDIPQTLAYVLEVGSKYDKMEPLIRLLSQYR